MIKGKTLTPLSSRVGTTLVEVLVALTLLALIAGALASATGLGLALFDRTSKQSEDDSSLALRRQLRTYLMQMSPVSPAPEPRSLFVGGRESFSFRTFSEAPFAPNASYMDVQVYVSDKANLMLEVIGYDQVGEQIGKWGGTLAKSVDGVELLYLTHRTPNPIWVNDWTDDTVRPALVGIKVDPGSNPPWPDFFVAPVLR